MVHKKRNEQNKQENKQRVKHNEDDLYNGNEFCHASVTMNKLTFTLMFTF